MGVLERVRESATDTEAVASPIGSEPLAATAAPVEVRAALKRALVDRLGLREMASLVSSGDVVRARDELSVACVAAINAGEVAGAEALDVEALVREVIDEVLGLGPLQPLLDDDSITEVMVNGCRSLYFERDGKLEQAERVFDSPEQIMLAIDRILAPLGRRLDDANPIVNARLSNGFRVNAVISPVAMEGPALTIRKFSGAIRSLPSLVGLGSLPAWYARLLGWAVRLRCDIAVAGGTGSGKTTLLNALSAEIDPRERIVTIEDSAELHFEEGLHVVRLEARDASIEGTGAVSIRTLVTNALRMRPDRIVVGEVRGEECIDMLQAMNTGHDGSLTTLHAGTAREAVSRLVLMARFGMDLPAALIEEQVATALDLIVMSRRMPDGSRVVSSTCEVGRDEAGGVALRELVSFDSATRSWQLVEAPRFVERAVREGLLGEGEVVEWRGQVP
ncbi:MAG: ATPase, T2SS/T4P/T4SS family [Parolsenella sp.]|uniref:CpaF family protein n=1 Tax=Parolsenella sp. TaxID=2083006 RepID=UPI002E763D9B|nr:ATPase, T2SS/T4P/T4SS family [Parolsenella sp.]MEE1373016.1 ATPase, T2SS/T4P/T4SS family [Parolsenella sp.]